MPALRCTACGGRISPETEWRGPAYLSEEVVVGFSCDDWRCGASWDRDGAVTIAASTHLS